MALSDPLDDSQKFLSGVLSISVASRAVMLFLGGD